MGKGVPYVKLAAVIFLTVVAAGGVLYYAIGNLGGLIPLTVTPGTPGVVVENEQTCIGIGGTWAEGKCTLMTQPETYFSYSLSNVYMTVMNALDKDATFGADDARIRVYPEGQFDFTGFYLEQDNNAATSGQVDLNQTKLKTGMCYDYLAYQGDGGTNLYAKKGLFCIPKLSGDKTVWSYDETVYLYTEGAFTESALDCSTDAFDESGDTVTLNKTAQTVQGCIDWDFTYTNSVAGSIIEEPVIVFEDSTSSPLTDINDIENIYVKVKTGGIGITLPSGNQRTEFLTADPIKTTTDGALGSADGFTGTVTICLPAAEADVGTGSFLMHFDDLGDYRTRDLDNDVRAAAETTTFTINT